jgi:glyoxylase-like metal-dependent hydrolase (beta-lactamase superfamily II)
MTAAEIIDIRSGQARSQLIVGAHGAALVDAGSDVQARAILAAMKSAGVGISDLRIVVLTHGDGDHIAAARFLQDAGAAEILAHELEADYVLGRLPAGFPFAKRAFHLVGRRLPRPHLTRLMSGARLEIGDVEIVHAPGHTPGHVVVYAGDAICAGDAFTTGDRFKEVPGLMTADRARSWATIRALAGRAVARAYSGHGPPVVGAAERLAELADQLPSSVARP